jgi:hypothetical protein
VPEHIDLLDDNLLAKFGERHGLDASEVPEWGDMYELPWCLLLSEQIAAVDRIVAGLRAQEHHVAAACAAGVGDDDSFWDSAETFRRMARDAVAAMPAGQQADFAALCLFDPALLAGAEPETS